MLDNNVRYLQIAFNYDTALALRLLPQLPRSERILIEAGTPFIKREGLAGIGAIRGLWPGRLVADLKTVDGASREVEMVRAAGATAATVLGSSPRETLDLFVAACAAAGIDSMIDMLGVADPLRVLMGLRRPPGVVVLHLGRDEESTRGKMIQYRHVNRVRSKFDTLISAAGGVGLKEARSAIFNGANIVVVNLVRPEDPWGGIRTDADVPGIARQFLETIE
ncbi:MAG: hypothetical protein JXO51_03245 [Candidatus Aminicenantes bacterium]|nr:hypothetical protein [Candidatus Aminicenantes bacterium]